MNSQESSGHEKYLESEALHQHYPKIRRKKICNKIQFSIIF